MGKNFTIGLANTLKNDLIIVIYFIYHIRRLQIEFLLIFPLKNTIVLVYRFCRFFRSKQSQFSFSCGMEIKENLFIKEIFIQKKTVYFIES